MKSRTDLISRTLSLLNALAAGQDPAPEDALAVDVAIDGKLTELSKRELYTSPSKTQFEDDVLDPLSVIIANTVAPDFGQPRNPDSVARAEATLRELKPSTYVPGSILAIDYF